MAHSGILVHTQIATNLCVVPILPSTDRYQSVCCTYLTIDPELMCASRTSTWCALLFGVAYSSGDSINDASTILSSLASLDLTAAHTFHPDDAMYSRPQLSPCGIHVVRTHMIPTGTVTT